HLSEHAGRYLIHPGGEPTPNVLKLVRPELRVELQVALQTARDRKEPFDSPPIQVQFDGESCPVLLHVRPALDPASEGFALVIFEERQPSNEAHALVDSGASENEAQRIKALEGEVSLARQRVQAIIEEYETSQEEMKS